MGLDVPELDDRSYEELLEEALQRLPVYTDEWTDHNAHDPGVTILETLAWLAETYAYQFDHVTDEHRRKYLELLGITPAPPTPASIELQITPPDGVAAVTLPIGVRFDAEDGSDSPEGFETDRPSTVRQASVEAVITDGNGQDSDHSHANEVDGMHYRPFGSNPAPGTALYIGFDGDPFVGGESLTLTFDWHDGDLPPVATHGDEPLWFEPSVELTWEYLSGSGSSGEREHPIIDDEWIIEQGQIQQQPVQQQQQQPAQQQQQPPQQQQQPAQQQQPPQQQQQPAQQQQPVQQQQDVSDPRDQVQPDGGWTEREPEWKPLELLLDETNRLYRGGTIMFQRPDEWSFDGRPPAEMELHGRSDLHWIRCVIDETGYEIPPQLDTIRTNVIEAYHRSTIEGEHLESLDHNRETTALAHQTFRFEHAPVVEAEITVDGELWKEVSDFDASGPDDLHYVLDRTNGTIRFGDGVRGRLPRAGHDVVASRYAHGGGEAGNVARRSIWTFHDEERATTDGVELGELTIEPIGRATGGSDAESVDDALMRAKRDLTVPYRAVTPDDYEYLAKHTPGVRISRTAIDRDTGSGTGRTCVIVVPYSPPDVRPPEPSDGVLDAVAAHLDRHRLLTDHVTVQAPTYVEVESSVTVRVHPGYGRRTIETAVQEVVCQYLDPLTGFDGNGWPFGRPLYRSELRERIARIDGIDGVDDVTVSAGIGGSIDGHGNVLIDETTLLSITEADVTVAVTASSDGGG